MPLDEERASLHLQVCDKNRNMFAINLPATDLFLIQCTNLLIFLGFSKNGKIRDVTLFFKSRRF